MSVRLIAGRAGSGKTRFCLNEIRQELARDRAEGPRLIFLVPEQAALQSERLLLALSEGTTLGRCEVLSFRRLAQRILSESTGGMPTPLTPIGRQMAVRFLLGRNRQQFKEFGRLADRGGFVAELAGALSELFRESVSVERLEACAKAAESEDAPTFPRLHDLAILYREYCDYLGDDRVDPDGVLALARARMAQAEWLRGARMWVDGFASFTREQLTTLVELSRLTTSLDVAILLDPARIRDDDSAADANDDPDAADLFAKTRVTMAGLFRSFAEAGVSLEPVKRLTDSPTRFDAAPALARLESDVFTQPGATGDEPDTPPTVEAIGEAQLVVANDLRDEARAAARAILDLTRRETHPMRYRDIAILVRSLEPHHDLLSAELRRHGIPFFIDRRRPTHHHPLVRLVRGLVGLIGGLSFESSMTQILKSGLAGIAPDDADAIDNYVLANGLNTPVQWDSPWTRKPPGFEDKRSNAAKESVSHVEQARISLRTRFGEFWPGASTPMICRDWITRLAATLDRFGVRATLDAWCTDAESRGDLDEASEHVQVWSGIVDLMEELVAALGDVELRDRQLRETLESGLSEMTLGLVPPTIDQVIVSSVDRGRQPPGLRAAFVLGLADGLWPGRIVDEGLLGDEERAFLEDKGAALGRSRLERLREERLLLYVGVTRASEVLWVSRPLRSADGKEMQPSLYWANLRAALGDATIRRTPGDAAEGISTTGDLAIAIAAALGKAVRPQPGDNDSTVDSSTLSIYNWAAGQADSPVASSVRNALTGLLPARPASLSTDATNALWTPPHETSVTRLESFARCAFQHYARYGLRLLPRDVHELSDVRWGQFYHAVLEQFVNELIETGESLAEMPEATIADRVVHLCTNVLPAFADDLNLDEAQRRNLSWRSRRELPAFLLGHAKTVGQTRLRPIGTEKNYGAKGEWPALDLTTKTGEKVSIRGKIDRIDLLADASARLAVVFDYKRKLNRLPALDEVYHGLALQLLAYLLVIRDHADKLNLGKVETAGALLLPINWKREKLDHPEAADDDSFAPFRKLRPRGLIDFDALSTIDPAHQSKASSVFSAYKSADGSPGYYDSTDVLRKGELDTVLAFVRGKMTQLCEAWLAGDISVRPARLGRSLPCDYCNYRAVCRFEYVQGQVRDCAKFSKTEAVTRMTTDVNIEDRGAP